MASVSSQEQSFTCSVCHELLRDPVAIPCGHNFCMKCINGWWDQEDCKRKYSCPLCKHTFDSRPILHKNPLIAEMVEMFRKTRIHAGPGDVACGACTVCMMDDHKGHETITAAAEWSQKKSQRRCQQIIQLKEKELQELRKAVETLKSGAKTAVEESERMFTEMVCSIERMCSEVADLIRAQEKAEVSRAEGPLKQLEQEIAELKRTDAEMKQLSQTQDPIYFLKNMGCIADYPSCDVTRRTFSQSHLFESLKESVSALKMQLKEKLESVFKQEMVKISAAATKAQIITHTDPELPVRRAECTENLPAAMSGGQTLIAETVTREDFLQLSDGQALIGESVIREDFLQYSCHFTLDPNTAHRVLHLSEGNKRVEYRRKVQSYPDHPDRFDRHPQVLCTEGVSAYCYWEVEWSGGVGIAVSYKNISRKGDGDECMFGGNDQSWRLYLSSSSSSFHHNNKQTELPLVADSRIGVYVDHRAGTLAFYSISDTMTLLHRVHTAFTHTLYPGFRLFSKPSSVTLL